MPKPLSAVVLAVVAALSVPAWLPAQVVRLPVALPAVRTDLHGDPLPPGAIARLGTVRLRHGEGIRHLALAPDGKTLASSSWDKTLRVWDTATGRELRRFSVPELRVNGLTQEFNYFTFSPDGRTLAANQDRDLCLLDPITGKVRVRCQGWCNHFAFTPDGKTLTAVHGSTVVQWDTGTGEKLREWAHDQADDFYRCAFSPDGQTIAFGDFGPARSSIDLWDVRTGEKVRSWEAHEKRVRDLAFSPDGKRVVSLSDHDKSVRLWDVATGKQIQQWPKQDGLYHLAMSPDGKTLALSGVHRPLWLLDWTTGAEIRTLDGGFGPIAFSGDGKTLAVAEGNHSIRVWDLRTGKPLHPTDEVFDVRYSPDGKVLVSRARSGVQLWDAATGKPGLRFPTNGPVAVSPDGSVLALIQTGPGKAAASMTVVETRTGKELGRSAIDGQHPWPVGWSEDGRFVAFGPERVKRNDLWSADAPSARWWDRTAGKEVRRLDGDLVVCAPDARTAAVLIREPTIPIEESNGGRIRHVQGMLRLADVSAGKDLFQLADCGTAVQGKWGKFSAFDPVFSPDGVVLAVASADLLQVRLWDVRTGKKLTELAAADYDFDLFDFSPDGQLLAVSDRENVTRMIQAGTGKVLHRLTTTHLQACTFSADSTLLATVDLYDRVELWEVTTGKLVRSWKLDAIKTEQLRFSPDGSSLTTVNSDGTALIWDLTGRLYPTNPSDRDLNQAWIDLAGEDAARADRAVWRMVAAAETAVPFLKQRLRPVSTPDADRVRRLIADLSHDRFAVREKAAQELERLGEVAGPALERALADRPALDLRERLTALLAGIEGQPWDGERLRARRSVRALECAGTAAARQALEALADGAPGARLTRDAKAAVRRLALRQRP
jgi:WD40 repeat protein